MNDQVRNSESSWVLLIPFLAAVAVYGHTIRFSLVWDDPMLLEYIHANYEAGGLVALLKAGFALRYPVLETTGYYRPIVLLSLWLDSHFSSFAPAAFHLTNVVLHGLNSVLVYLVVNSLYSSRRAALFSSLLFAVHPVNVEAVAFVSSRTDLWATFFLLTVVVVRFKWWDGRPSSSWIPYVLGSGFFFLALLSKEIAFAFPMAIPLLEWQSCDLGSSSISDWWARTKRWLLPVSIPFVMAIALRMSVVANSIGHVSLLTDPRSLVARLIWYFRLLVVPWPLNALYQQEALTPSPSTLVGVALFLILVAVSSPRRFNRVGIFGASWIVLFIAPALFGVSTYSPGAIAERYLYLPSVGLGCMFGVLVDRLVPQSRFRTVLSIALVLLAAAMVVGALRRSMVWRNNLSLFTDIVAKNPEVAEGHIGLGAAYQDRERLEEALVEYRKALTINPNYAPVLTNLGSIEERKGNATEAERLYREAASAMPDYAQPRFLLGKLYSGARKWNMAAAEFEAAVRLAPDMASAWYSLGAVNANLGMYARSTEAYERAIAVNPDNASWHFWLGMTYLPAGRPEKAHLQRQWLESRDPELAGKLTAEISRWKDLVR